MTQRNLTLTNVAAAPTFDAEAIGLNMVRVSITDGQGGAASLVLPRSQAQKIASSLNGVANTQIRTELERGEAAGTLTEAQTRKLGRIRAAAEHVAQMNATRAANKAERDAAKTPGKGKLKAVA